MTERLLTLRAALWRAVALTLADKRIPKWEQLHIIAVAKHVDENLTLSAQLFDRAARRSAAGEG